MLPSEQPALGERLLGEIKANRAGQDVADAAEESVKVVLLRAGSACYAFYGSNIQEILSGHEIYWVPGLPDWLPGLIHVRGDIESVLAANPQVAAVCGRRRERFPQKSVFNRLCETEWNTPVGEAKSCGGDSLMRRDALEQAGGFNESLIAGEEPELCLRLRKAGWKIWRIDKDMTRHDANILRWDQWWRRNMRGGYGAADVAARTASDHALGEVLFGGQVQSAQRWVRGIACAIVAAIAAAAAGYFLAAIAIVIATGAAIVLQMARIARGARRRCPDWRSASEYGILTVLAKFPQFLGIRKYARDRRSNTGAKLIEYKT